MYIPNGISRPLAAAGFRDSIHPLLVRLKGVLPAAAPTLEELAIFSRVSQDVKF
jgi:hypothetical protein